MSKHSVEIQWGIVDPDEPDQNIETYSFNTVEELNAFMTGVAAADGWTQYAVLFDSREVPKARDIRPPLDRPNLVTIHDLPPEDRKKIEIFKSGQALQWRPKANAILSCH